MIEILADTNVWASLLTLTAMEVVLGIDNLVFISVLASRLPEHQQAKARAIGLGLALLFRIIMLFGLTYLIALREPEFVVYGHEISWRDIILLGGGLFLLAKATLEIHGEIEGHKDEGGGVAYSGFYMVIAQIAVIDMVFSVDSIITAIGMTEYIGVMIAAVTIAIAVMFVASEPATRFIERHPTTKMLALSFLILIGVLLVADGMGFHVPRGYVYFAMGFAAMVEVFNVLARRARRGGTA
ncbi:TerC family protein [Dichotomicrobium thermohalophilum]|uniref:Putative tellurium resistance membrane protein TerC n=1 Tax=Dichotomicrobium thermohalophilum TaxID=933063 RepID=A0A397PD10_9HYPH|nr:TerC family protein [Dichotomicrobium thermohalophilum]RIA47410.1 putative tellurium resistance membrane protein TerC [Dichotomicrobium thermohalophilum]